MITVHLQSITHFLKINC